MNRMFFISTATVGLVGYGFAPIVFARTTVPLRRSPGTRHLEAPVIPGHSWADVGVTWGSLTTGWGSSTTGYGTGAGISTRTLTGPRPKLTTSE